MEVYPFLCQLHKEQQIWKRGLAHLLQKMQCLICTSQASPVPITTALRQGEAEDPTLMVWVVAQELSGPLFLLLG